MEKIRLTTKVAAKLTTKIGALLVIVVAITGLVVATVVSNLLSSPPADVAYGQFVSISFSPFDLDGTTPVSTPTQFDITPDSTAETGDSQYYYIFAQSLSTLVTGKLSATWCSDTGPLEIGDVTFFVETATSGNVWEAGGGLDDAVTTDPKDFTTGGADFGDWVVDGNGCLTVEWDRYFRGSSESFTYRNRLRFTTFARIGIPAEPLTLELLATAFD